MSTFSEAETLVESEDSDYPEQPHSRIHYPGQAESSDDENEDPHDYEIFDGSYSSSDNWYVKREQRLGGGRGRHQNEWAKRAEEEEPLKQVMSISWGHPKRTEGLVGL